MTQVEQALRSQRSAWHTITQRVATKDARALPFEQPKRIILFGLGSSHYAARLTALSLIRDRTRKRIPVIACSSMSIGQEVIPTGGDWVLAFSHRARTGPTLQALEYCERAGAYTLLVCAEDVEVPETARHAVRTVPVETVEPHTVSVTGAVCAATTLLGGPKALEEWDAIRSIGEPDLDLCRERAGHGPTLLLGEWEGEWLAREGALKLMEMARIPVRAYSSEEFFHGPRYSLTAEDRVWHICLPKDSRVSEIQTRHRIEVFGATPLAWVPALVELQWLALATALNLGVDPDLKNS